MSRMGRRPWRSDNLPQIGEKTNCMAEKEAKMTPMTIAVGAEVLAVGRDQGHDDPEPNEVNEDREEDDENGGLSHGRKSAKGRAVSGWSSNDMARVYWQIGGSQVDGRGKGRRAVSFIGRFPFKLRQP